MVDAADWMDGRLKGLNRTESAIIRLYYVEGLMMNDIGRALGISESRVSQVHSQLLLRLRAKMERDARPR